MDLEKLLAILKEINAIISALEGMGLKVDGTINLSTILALVHKGSA